MSKQQTSKDIEDGTVSEDAVVAYLEMHPDFFEKHPALLAELKLQHTTGKAVSLIERQVSVLREQKRETDEKLHNLIQIARENDALYKRLQKMTLALMEATGIHDVIATLQDSLRHDFSADKITLRLFRKPEEDIPIGDVDYVEKNDKALAAFRKFLETRKPICGHLGKEQSLYLFGDDANIMGSAALVALCDSQCFGMLAIGSQDAKRFHAGMGTLFLGYLGEIAGRALSPYLEDL